jgi:hypothetical protein
MVPVEFDLLRNVQSTPTLYIDSSFGLSDGVNFLPFLRIFNFSLLQLNILNMPSLIASKYVLSPHFCYEYLNICMIC